MRRTHRDPIDDLRICPINPQPWRRKMLWFGLFGLTATMSCGLFMIGWSNILSFPMLTLVLVGFCMWLGYQFYLDAWLATDWELKDPVADEVVSVVKRGKRQTNEVMHAAD
jgi:hypothetical protein